MIFAFVLRGLMICVSTVFFFFVCCRFVFVLFFYLIYASKDFQL